MRARIKSYDQLPEIWKCCPDSIAGLLDMTAKSEVVEITSKAFNTDVHCESCGNSINIDIYLENRKFYPVDSYDFDEGA